ncbi:uncharacterized protein LOC130448380 isoform X2 [Diorhabda sublineata]|uniref:uncharacterized protein LOC130448380 isoform X2 n=1 Tax=Diorhabda sublineata TaxID=1163346 RepID=UPI0024E192A6|nr:uncharacterized protein LOC130448380 isoform X2 [Diorhabda sublineata]
MMWPYVRWLVLLVTILVLQSDWTTAAPNPHGDDMMRLLKLDQMYSSVARPRFGKRVSQSSSQYAPLEYDNQYRSDQDVGDWLPVRR